MTAVSITLITVLAFVALSAFVRHIVAADGYGHRSRPPSSRMPDVFDPPAWHSPWL